MGQVVHPALCQIRERRLAGAAVGDRGPCCWSGSPRTPCLTACVAPCCRQTARAPPPWELVTPASPPASRMCVVEPATSPAALASSAEPTPNSAALQLALLPSLSTAAQTVVRKRHGDGLHSCSACNAHGMHAACEPAPCVHCHAGYREHRACVGMS